MDVEECGTALRESVNIRGAMFALGTGQGAVDLEDIHCVTDVVMRSPWHVCFFLKQSVCKIVAAWD